MTILRSAQSLLSTGFFSPSQNEPSVIHNHNWLSPMPGGSPRIPSFAAGLYDSSSDGRTAGQINAGTIASQEVRIWIG